jgi:hypothetical protein
MIVATQSTDTSDAIQGHSGLDGLVKKYTIHVADLPQLSITRVPSLAIKHPHWRGETETRTRDPHRRMGGERRFEDLNRYGRGAQRMSGTF